MTINHLFKLMYHRIQKDDFESIFKNDIITESILADAISQITSTNLPNQTKKVALLNIQFLLEKYPWAKKCFEHLLQ